LKYRFTDITKVVFLKRLEGKLWVLRAIRLHKTSQANSSKSLFSMNRMQKMNSNSLSTPWNITSSTSPKSFFNTSRLQIISTQANWPN
jgi:hypothetical protein